MDKNKTNSDNRTSMDVINEGERKRTLLPGRLSSVSQHCCLTASSLTFTSSNPDLQLIIEIWSKFKQNPPTSAGSLYQIWHITLLLQEVLFKILLHHTLLLLDMCSHQLSNSLCLYEAHVRLQPCVFVHKVKLTLETAHGDNRLALAGRR